jgi:HK97 family phage major capsid protein
MTSTTANFEPILTPEEVNTYLVEPVERDSLAMQVATVVSTDAPSYRFPVFTSEPSAAWVAEGAEIPVSDAEVDEVEVTPTKVAGLHFITRELAEDSSPQATETVANRLVLDIVRKVDASFFGNLASPAPKGLGSLAVNATVEDVQGLDVTAFDSLDVFAEAQSLAEQVGAQLTSFVAHPDDALALALLKVSTGSNQTLLGSDPTAPTRRLIGGVPLLVSAAVPKGVIWGIPKNRVFVVVRDDAKWEADSSVAFTSDRVAIKATMRVGFGYPQPSALVKITKTA